MPNGMNKVLIVGNLGRDPEVRYTQSGTALLSFSVAASESYESKGERHERTEWITVVVWGKPGEALSKRLRKGSRVFVEGRLATRSWEDKQGQKRYSTEVVAANVIPTLDESAPPRANGDDDYVPSGTAEQRALGDDNIPF